MTSEKQISREESKGISELLFKDGNGHLHDSWKQGFYFDDKIKYGIHQQQGGPCGILATIQAFFLKHLLYGAKMSLHYLKQKNFTNQMQNCLALAISDVLYNSTNDGETNVSLVIPQGQISSKNQPVQPHQCTRIEITNSNDISVIYNLVKCYLNLFSQADSQGVILLVYSVILTRGINNIKGDMDLEGSTLLNEHGYASQEIINIMLIGQAKSNVHDGDKDLGDNFVLKGIDKRSDVGFLTFFEAFGYFTVGENFKTPQVPIWVVCSESHYSVIFSVDQNNIKKTGQTFDLVYYDELARQEDDIILTVQPGKYTGKSASDNKNPVPIDEVIRTKWTQSQVSWNGRTVIL